MLIPNSLRQEDMPQMVYAILKQISNGKYTKDDVKKRVTASIKTNIGEKSQQQFSRLLSFLFDAEMIYEKGDVLYTYFDEEELQTINDFSYSLLGKMQIDKNNKFDMMLKWYLSTDVFNESNFTSSAEKIAHSMMECSYLKAGVWGKISQNDVHGFLFWVEMFKIAYFEERRSGHVYFGIENIMMEYIKRHPELREKGDMSTEEFLNALSQDLYFIPMCYEEGTHNIMHALSLGIRVLENAEIIELNYRDDSDQRWHLTNSTVFTSGNTFTNVRIK